MTIIGQKINYGAIFVSAGIEIFESRSVRARPSDNIRKKVSIIADEPRQMTIAAIKWICRKFE